MDGKEYISSFRFVESTAPDHDLGAAANEGLNDLLLALYSDQDVLFLGSLGMSGVVKVAEESLEGIEGLSEVAQFSQLQVHNKKIAAGLRPQSDKPAKPETIIDISEELSTEELTKDVDNVRSVFATKGRLFSDELLSRTIRQVERSLSGHAEADPVVVGNIVSQRIGMSRSSFLQHFTGFAGFIKLKRDINKPGVVDEVVSVRPYTRKEKWLESHDEWDDPLHMLASQLQEMDVYVGLLEWVRKNKLPYVPVFPPSEVESGVQIRGSKNRRADLLLCSLVDNEIIPVQVKNAALDYREKYDSDVAIISANDLGSEKFENGIGTRKNGRHYTTTFKTSTHGELFTMWIAENRRRHGKKSKDYQERLNLASAAFDSQIKPLMKRVGVK